MIRAAAPTGVISAVSIRISALGTVRAKSVEAGWAGNWRLGMTNRSPFRYFKTSPEIIRLTVMMYIRFPLSLRNVEDHLLERGIEIIHETVRLPCHQRIRLSSFRISSGILQEKFVPCSPLLSRGNYRLAPRPTETTWQRDAKRPPRGIS